MKIITTTGFYGTGSSAITDLLSEYNNICCKGDYEIRIAMEDFLNKFLPYVKQSDVWRFKAEQYKDSPWQFDVHFEELTTFIPVVK